MILKSNFDLKVKIIRKSRNHKIKSQNFEVNN